MGETKETAVPVQAEPANQVRMVHNGEIVPVPFLVANCAKCGNPAALSGPGRHQCLRCRIWLLYLPRTTEYSL